MQVGRIPLHSIQDVQTALKHTKADGHLYCDLTRAHAKLWDGLTQDGIPQVNIDQLNTRFLLTRISSTTSKYLLLLVVGYIYAFSKLTPGKLLKQPDWKEWQASEYLQLDQYKKQFMFGMPTEVVDRKNLFHLVWTYTVKDLNK